MKRVTRIVLALVSILLCLSAYAGIPNTNHPTTFLGPTLQGSFTDVFTDQTAYSVAGEAGFKNFRAAATLAYLIRHDQRIKATVEFLWQDITYPFFAGNTNQWVSQGALGAAYQFDMLGYTGNPQFDLSAFVSHAPSKSLSTVTGTFINRAGVTQNFVDLRRIAGSNAAGISPGVSVQPWVGGRAGAELNYDNVRYDTIYGRNRDAKGFGGTVFLTQAIANNVNLNLLAAVRQPFNNYVASIDWINVPYFGATAIGIEGAYTAGKNTLPSSYNASLTVDYFMDQFRQAPPNSRLVRQEFLAWTGAPAVYLPQVLAIPDERVTVETPQPPGCPFAVPALITTIPDQSPPIGVSTLDIKPFFSGDSLTYTLNVITPPTFPGDSVTIDGNGVLTITNVAPTTPDSAVVSITATNPCGTVTSNTFIIEFFSIG